MSVRPIQEEPDRYIYLNDATKNAAVEYASNYVSTTKYSPWSFLPKFLYEQFTRYANIFFLILACIQVWRVPLPSYFLIMSLTRVFCM